MDIDTHLKNTSYLISITNIVAGKHEFSFMADLSWNFEFDFRYKMEKSISADTEFAFLAYKKLELKSKSSIADIYIFGFYYEYIEYLNETYCEDKYSEHLPVYLWVRRDIYF